MQQNKALCSSVLEAKDNPSSIEQGKILNNPSAIKLQVNKNETVEANKGR